MALANSTSYQTALNTIKSDRRSLLAARDGMRPDVTLSATVTKIVGRTGAFAPMIGLPSTTRTGSLAFTIPLDDVNAKSSLISAQITLKKDETSLVQSRRDVITKVTNDINTLKTNYTTVTLNQKAAKYSAQSLTAARINYTYGKINSFQLTQQSDNLLTAENSVITSEITYINSVAQFVQSLGLTLHQWDVQIQY